MSGFIEFFLTPVSPGFGGLSIGMDKAEFVLVGVPFDSTVWHRPGCRFGPSHIRRASMGLEGNSIFTGLFLEEVGIHDAGDLEVLTGHLGDTQRRLENVVSEIASIGKRPIVIGGEHSLTLAAVRALNPDLVVVFDAHLDLRGEWPPGVRNSYATVMRRISERIGVENILFIGSRAFSKEEMDYVSGREVTILTPKDIESDLEGVMSQVASRISEARRCYVTIDMDVLEPGFAPGVGDPEPYGLTPRELMRLISSVFSNPNIVGFDVMEVSPPNDCGDVTSYYAAKIIVEAAASLRLAK